MIKPVIFSDEKKKQFVIDIINIVEDMLVENDILKLNDNYDEDRELDMDGEMAVIYGDDYYNLEDKLKDLVNDFLEGDED